MKLSRFGILTLGSAVRSPAGFLKQGILRQRHWRCPEIRAPYFRGDGAGARASPLLHPHVLGEIIIRSAFALEPPAYTLGVVSARKHLRQEALLRGPAGVGLRLAVTARHGVVEPAVRRALVDVNLVALIVGFKGIAQPPHVLERDDVVGFTEGGEDGAGERCNGPVVRLRA